MAFSSGNDINVLTAGDSANVGAGAGNDRYILSPGSALTAGQVINITDTLGTNTLQLTGGLTITSSKVSADALQLTLSNGATVNVLGANTFTFELGGDPLAGTPGTVQNFATFVTTTLALAAVPTGSNVSNGAANVAVNANGTTTNGGTPPVVVVPPAPASFVLTTAGTDAIVGTAAAETITAVNSSLLSEGTLQVTDAIDGGDGLDTINVSMSQGFAGFTTGSMKNVETVNLTNATIAEVNFSGIKSTGVTKYVVDATKAAVTLSDVASLAAVEVKGPAAASNISVGYSVASTVATGSQIDTQVLKVTDVGTATLAGTVAIAKVEALALETAGTLNTLNLSGVVDAKTITVTGGGATTINAVSAAVTSFDASAVTGKMTVNLSNAAANSLTNVKTGAGDDVITVLGVDLTANAVISGGAGANKLVFGAGAGKTLQNSVTGIQTIDVGAVTSELKFSGANTADLATVNVENIAAAVNFVNMKATALTVNAVGTIAQSLSTDNAAAVTYNLDANAVQKTAGTAAAANTTAASFANATAVTVNVNALVNSDSTITAALAKDVTVNVGTKVDNAVELTKFNGTLVADEATKLTITSAGQLDTATVTAGKATSAVIVAGSTATALDTLALNAAKINTLNVTAKQDFTFVGSTLTGLQNLTVDTTKAYTQSVALNDAAAVVISGAAPTSQATFSTLGNTDGSLTHNVNLAATGLKLGLTAGNINAGTASSTVDVSSVTGFASTGTINAANGVTVKAANIGGALSVGNITTTTGNASVDATSAASTVSVGNITTSGITLGDVSVLASNVIGNLTVGALTGNNVTFNAQNALGTVSLGTITAKTSATVTAANLVPANAISIVADATSTAFTATVNGGAGAETVTIAGGVKQTSIIAKGDLGAGVNKVTVTLGNNDATTTVPTQIVNLSGLTSTAAVKDATFETETILSAAVTGNDKIAFIGSVKDDLITLGSTGAIDQTISITDVTTTDLDTLALTGTAPVLTALTLSGIERITVATAATLNATAVSGQSIDVVNAANTLTLTGTAGNETIDLSSVTTNATAAANFVVNGLDGNDTIIGTKTGPGTYNGGAGNDVITANNSANSFDGGSGADTITGGTAVDTVAVTVVADGTHGADRVNLGAGIDLVNVDTTVTTLGAQVRLTFTSADVGNNDALDGNNTAATTGMAYAGAEDGGLAVRFELENAGGSVTGETGASVTPTVARYDDEGIAFAGSSATAFDVRDLGTGAARGVFQNVVLGTNGNDTFAADNTNIAGVAANETVYVNAGAGDDTVTGGDINDFLVGGSGNDSLVGGKGLDTLLGGAGVDSMTGGNDADTFAYTSLATVAAQTGITLATADLIVDFTTTVDFIKLDTAGTNANYAEAAAAANFAAALAAANAAFAASMGTPSALNYYLTSTMADGGLLFINATPNDGTADALIKLTGVDSTKFEFGDIIA